MLKHERLLICSDACRETLRHDSLGVYCQGEPDECAVCNRSILDMEAAGGIDHDHEEKGGEGG